MSLAGLALAASLFVHFNNPRTGEPVFAKYPDGHELAGQDNPDAPVGVDVFGPGSKEYREAQSAITNEAIARKNKKLTAEVIERNAVELIARTTRSFVNFDYEGQPCTPEMALAMRAEVCRKFYRDPRFVHLKEQVQAAMGDHGNFLDDGSTS